jgi:hypothetical protein
MSIIPNSPSPDVTDGASSHLKGEAFAQAALDDDGGPALAAKAPPRGLRAQIYDLAGRVRHRMSRHPLTTMSLALGAGFLVGRLRARRVRHRKAA